MLPNNRAGVPTYESAQMDNINIKSTLKDLILLAVIELYNCTYQIYYIDS